MNDYDLLSLSLLLTIIPSSLGEGSALSPPKLNGSDRSKLLPSLPDSPGHSWMPSPMHDPQWYPNDSSDSSLGCLLCECHVNSKLI